MGTTEYNNQHLLTIPVDDVLAHFGKSAVHRGYMYYSPFRSESNRSMRVTVNAADGTWIWYDHGMGEGGGCLQMVMRLMGTSSEKEAMQELERIAESRGLSVIAEEVRESRRKASKTEPLRVVAVSDGITSRKLRNYFTITRCIPEDILNRYCKEISYRTRSDGRLMSAAGFPNNGGGYAVRGCGKFKMNYGQTSISTFSNDGVLLADGSASCGKGDMFEGFVNFLSKIVFLRENTPATMSTGIDSCVLHSASMVSHAREWVLAHTAIRTFFDNDAAGDRATETVRSWCAEAGIDFKDGRSAYREYNDINDALQAYKSIQNRNVYSRGI